MKTMMNSYMTLALALLFVVGTYAVEEGTDKRRTYEIDVQISKGGSVDFMASFWLWPKPETWEDLLREKMQETFRSLKVNKGKVSSNFEVKGNFNWITAVRISPGGQMGGVKDKGGKYQMQYAEVSLKGKLNIRLPEGSATEIPFRATSVMFWPNEQFISNLFDAAVFDMVAGLGPIYLDQDACLKWLWQRRNKLPQSIKHRHVEKNPKAKEGEPNEVVFEVREPGPMLWDILLRIGTQASLERVLKVLVECDKDTQIAISRSIHAASNRKEFKSLLSKNREAVMATFDRIASEPKELLQKCIAKQKPKD